MVGEEAVAAYYLVAHTFANSLFEFEVEIEASPREEPQMSSSSVNDLVGVQPRKYSRRRHRVDYWMHDHTHSASSHSAALAGNQPLSLGAICPVSANPFRCQQVLEKSSSLLEVAEGPATTSVLEGD